MANIYHSDQSLDVERSVVNVVKVVGWGWVGFVIEGGER